MTKIIRAQLITLFAMLTALVVTLAACGGGTSAGAGGGSGSTIAGTVNSGIAAVSPAGEEQPRLLLAAMDLLIEPARADGVAGITVELVSGGVVVASQVTGADGHFSFSGLAPGSYSIRLSQGITSLGETEVVVGSSSTTEVQIDISGGVLSVEVNAGSDQVTGEVEDETGSDDSESLDDDGVDDQSTEDDGEDDSEDDGIDDVEDDGEDDSSE